MLFDRLSNTLSWTKGVIFIKEEEAIAFAEWAFGPTYNDMTLPELLHSWNSKHGKKLFIEEDETVYDSLVRMKEVWLKGTC